MRSAHFVALPAILIGTMVMAQSDPIPLGNRGRGLHVGRTPQQRISPGPSSPPQLSASPQAVSARYRVLYRFTGSDDGYYPGAPLVRDKAGNLYGTTSSGGSKRNGTIFQLGPPVRKGGRRTFKVLHAFTSFDDGWNPDGLVLDDSGCLYGAKPGYPDGYGGIYRLCRPARSRERWTYKEIYRFKGGAQHDGSEPDGQLAFDHEGNLYGTTYIGGQGYGCNADGCGTVFRLKRPAKKNAAWTESVLHRFTGGTDGGLPSVGLTLDKQGNLYGTTGIGGNDGYGVAFQIERPSHGTHWVEKILHSFDLNMGGGGPGGPVLFDKEGNLYGTTAISSPGEGEVFKLSRPSAGNGWTEHTLYAFTGGDDGGYPMGRLVFGEGGSLYGVTSVGGPHGGAIFRLTPPSEPDGQWTETTLHDFDVASGYSPQAGLIWGKSLVSGLYGTTRLGGNTNCTEGCGVVFELLLKY